MLNGFKIKVNSTVSLSKFRLQKSELPTVVCKSWPAIIVKDCQVKLWTVRAVGV
jgi:hypothetical protein